MSGAIWGMTGVEGGGKSAWMTYLSALHLNMGGWCQTFDGYDVYHPKNHNIKLSQSINPVKWLQLPPDLLDLQTDADEIQNHADSALSGAVFARVANRTLAMRRKRRTSLEYTVQNWQWVHNRIRWLTHYLSICQDLYHTPWGKEAGIGRGEYIRITTFDCKGFATGKPWTQLQPYTLYIKPMWAGPSAWWESYEPTSAFAGEVKLELLKHKEKIDLRTTDEIHAASRFGRRLLADGISDRVEDGITYTQPREHDNFERGLEAIERSQETDLKLMEDLANSGASAGTILKLNRRLNVKRADELKSVRKTA